MHSACNSSHSFQGEVAAKIGPNPYRGLLAFHQEDAPYFFGREQQTRRVYERFRELHETETLPTEGLRCLPILGPSGSGKSSLARAGLIPELADPDLVRDFTKALAKCSSQLALVTATARGMKLC